MFIDLYDLIVFDKNDINSDYLGNLVLPEISIDRMSECDKFLGSNIIMKILDIIHYLDLYKYTVHIILHHKIYLSSSDSKVFGFASISMRFIEFLYDSFSLSAYFFSILIV
jgi:hypothetical protein